MILLAHILIEIVEISSCFNETSKKVCVVKVIDTWTRSMTLS